MTHRHRLTGGMPRLLGNHKGTAGARFRAHYRGLAQEWGPFSQGSLLAAQAGRCAVLWLGLEDATRRWLEAQAARDRGTGRRPSELRVHALMLRHRQADQAYGAALEALRDLAHSPEQRARRGRYLQARTTKPVSPAVAPEPGIWPGGPSDPAQAPRRPELGDGHARIEQPAEPRP